MSRAFVTLDLRKRRNRGTPAPDGATPAVAAPPPPPVPEPAKPEPDGSRYVVPLGRALFAVIFLTNYSNFSGQAVAYARHQGVPLAGLAVPLAGVLVLAGAISIVLGYRAKLGAWLLALFLVAVTMLLHRFWGVSDEAVAQLQRMMFLKNVSLLGGALLIAHFGAGPVSVDAWRQKSSARN